MSSFFQSRICRSKARCEQCRNSKGYKLGIVMLFGEPSSVDFECPFRILGDNPSILVRKRVETCVMCQHLVDGVKCAKCGCDIRVKIDIEVARCPEGRW